MVKIAHIMPTAYLSSISKTGQYEAVGMALAHLALQDAAYRRFYQQPRVHYNFVILDNSAFELGEAIQDAKFIEAIRLIKPDEVVLPDALFDAKSTLTRVTAFLTTYKDTVSNMSLMAVPHGATMAEYLSSYESLAHLEEVDTLGIGTIYNERFKQGDMLGREVIFQELQARGMLSLKAHHLLGLGDNGNHELAKAANWSFVRSCDTSAAYINALQGRLIKPEGYKKNSQKVDFGATYDSGVATLLRKNITTLDKESA